ncbi:hypothetical protein JCM16418_2622 [Paenibacillus pini JCM 16418]|uniref:Dystroglycan-type cadherin-like domain-containing protein n=2 Tax=Paenibacillus TaxID=44249 RepID=W7YC85_9BACL|nr:hypothetical protein JCM16418_2622 [Paenibacillus pini JCM 16418]
MSAGEVASGAMQNVTSTDWLGQNFGIRFRYNSVGDVTKTDTVKYDQSFGITAGVNDVEMHSGSTLVILNPKVAKGVIYLPQNVPGWNNAVENSDKAHFPNGGVYKNGGVAEGPYAAIAKLNKGKAAFIGDSSPVEDASPAYVREDTGAKKTTYDGFKGEAQDAVFLVQTVEWLAVHEEDYTTFENKGITLDAPTPLLGALEEPATSAEIAGTEPWNTPVAGYKWYDPSTYKAGSYGSGSSGPVVTIPELTSIASARQAADSSYVTVQGVITSEPGIFGGTGFYMQDGTAGIYVYPSKATGYHVGDKVKISAQKTTYNTEAELLSELQITKLDDQASLPTPVALPQNAVNDANQGQLISIQNAVISKYAVVTGSLEFDLVNGSNTNHVRIDSRTNINSDIFKQTYPEGTAVHITGISSIFKGAYQLKLLNLGDIRPSSPAAENHPPVFKEVSPQNTVVGQAFSLKVEATDADGDAIVYSAVSLPDGASFDSAGGLITWTPEQSGSYDIKLKAVDAKGAEATLTVRVTVSAAQTGANHTATLTGPSSAYPETSIDLPIGVLNPVNGFTALDVIVHYDPSKLDVATSPNGDGTLSLADSAVTSSRDGLGLLASGVKPDQGLIRIIMGSAGAQHAVTGSGELLKLHVKLKANLPDGKTDISLSDFQVSLDGTSSTLDTTAATWSIEVKSTDRTALSTAINSAQSLYDQAVVGSNPGQYPADAKSALQQAITAASAVRNNAAATQQELNNAITALTNAVNIFKNAVNPSVPTVPAEKAALVNAITAAQSLYDRSTTGDKIGQYPADAKSALKLAIQNAQVIKNSASATQAQVDAATASLNSAIALFQTKLVSLVPGATKITIQDLSIISKYYGVTSTDPNWSQISKADLFGEGEISIRVLASVAQMIIGDWYVN